VWSHLPGAEAERAAEDLALLDTAERARAARYRFERDRVRFVRRRAFVRRVLAGYLALHPANVQLRVSVYGRPQLGPAAAGLAFSVSQADDLTAVAVSKCGPVGIDVERLRAIDGLDIARDRFTTSEYELLRSLEAAAQATAFLTLWTCKESVVKAIGMGLSMPLDAFTVLTRAHGLGGRPRDDRGVMPYAFAPVRLPPGYVGTVTVAGHLAVVRSPLATEVGPC
jgi:4'-phosphopantetheinyl transferase